MKVTHRLTVTARCPVDGLSDVYECVVRCDRVVPVEKILEAARSASARAIFQEDLGLAIPRSLGVSVTLPGRHSGVETEVTCE